MLGVILRMERLITRVVNQIKLNDGSRLHVVQKISIVRDVLEKYKKTYQIKRGFLNISAFGTPMCFTYFWLENTEGDTLDIIKYIKPTDEKYFFSENVLAGTECIDDSDCKIMNDNNRIWSKVHTKEFFSQDEWRIRQAVVSKHPVKNFQI